MKNIYLILFLVILLFSSCGNTVESPYEPIEFKKLTTMPGNGRSSAVAFAINDKGYVALGRNNNGETLKDCWEYDPINNTWLEKKSFPGVGRVKAMATVLNGKAYVGLGFDFDNDSAIYNVKAYLKDFWMYDPENDSWSQKDSLPSSATNACVSFVYKNELYIGGGFNGWRFTLEFWKYSPANDNWTRLNDFPGMGRAGSVVCATNDHVFYGTGYSTANENDWWEYFPETDSWKKRKSLPDNGRENGVSMAIGNRYFVSTGKHFGGSLTGGHVKSDILEYDVTRDVWYQRGNIPNGARENAIAFTIAGKGYIGFGDSDPQVLNDFWSFEL